MTYQVNQKLLNSKREPQLVRADFKEAYYSIGDKIVSLEMLKDDMKTPRARRELAQLADQFDTLHKALKSFGNQHLKNWD